MEDWLRDWMLNYGEDLQVGLFVGALACFVVIERVWPRRRPAVKKGRITTNALLTATAILTLPLVPVSLIAAAFWAEAEGWGLLNNLPVALPLWLLAFVTLLLRGFISFATHYLNHKIPVLWRIHRVHHMDTALDVSSTVRFHPLEMPLSAAISVPMVIALGLPPWLLLVYELFDVLITLFSHSNTRLPQGLEPWLRYVIVTPGLHTVHHSSNPEDTDSNFSAVFPVWDVLFRTFRTEPHEPLELGLREYRGDEVDRFGWLLISPFQRARKLGAPEVGAGP
jgi:sterol desaturase/sphingolipid hydroxylase (fatty acid hydroxylase superfamily)